jgi:hypothetical protein
MMDAFPKFRENFTHLATTIILQLQLAPRVVVPRFVVHNNVVDRALDPDPKQQTPSAQSPLSARL